jgi:hypothetical protein|tara:strand:+ start:1321 stop:1707 length:387 start_codon:yes stop_codon:yes gene_type:complete
VPANSIQADIRDALKTAFSGLQASTYNSVPESVITPAIVIVPGTPYLEPTLLSKGNVKVKVNMTATALVSYNSNPASLDNIEKLIISILAALPAGYIVGVVERPLVQQIGAAQYLTADINISTYYTQT